MQANVCSARDFALFYVRNATARGYTADARLRTYMDCKIA